MSLSWSLMRSIGQRECQFRYDDLATVQYIQVLVKKFSE